MLNSLTDFFTSINAIYVLIGVFLLGISSSVVGTFTFIRKRSLLSDVVSHSILPGICLSFIIFQSKDFYWLLLGAFITGGASIYLVEFIKTHSKIKEDSAMGIILSFFFGLGVMLLTNIQNSGSGNQSGLDKFLFGKAASIVLDDVLIISISTILIVALIILFYRILVLLSFDELFMTSIGFPVKITKLLITTLTITTISIGIQAVGIVLISAIMIIPPSIARLWTYNVKKIILLGIGFNTFSVFIGVYLSFIYANLPTGACIVLILAFQATLSLLFAPKKGLFSKYLKMRTNQKKMLEDNIIKSIYHLLEYDLNMGVTINHILEKRNFKKKSLISKIDKFKRKGWLRQSGNEFFFTKDGLAYGSRITRLHRIWELYLTTKLRLLPNQVHNSAESIEHIITPELEAKIMEELNYPELDPHNKKIPNA